MAIQVKNKLRQPLVINIPEQEAIHFLAKEEKELTDEQFNAPDLKKAVELEQLVVLRME